LGLESPEQLAQCYPVLYSQKRLDDWEALFDSRAVVFRVESGRPVFGVGIHTFLSEQREYAADNQYFLETWDRVEIHRYGAVAIIKADYCLTTDHEIRKGIDVLTLLRENGRWRIGQLIYEQTEFIQR
jgi:hypothetical protein